MIVGIKLSEKKINILQLCCIQIVGIVSRENQGSIERKASELK